MLNLVIKEGRKEGRGKEREREGRRRKERKEKDVEGKRRKDKEGELRIRIRKEKDVEGRKKGDRMRRTGQPVFGITFTRFSLCVWHLQREVPKTMVSGTWHRFWDVCGI